VFSAPACFCPGLCWVAGVYAHNKLTLEAKSASIKHSLSHQKKEKLFPITVLKLKVFIKISLTVQVSP